MVQLSTDARSPPLSFVMDGSDECEAAYSRSSPENRFSHSSGKDLGGLTASVLATTALERHTAGAPWL